jgi:hypothetical protein
VIAADRQAAGAKRLTDDCLAWDRAVVELGGQLLQSWRWG